MNKKLQVFVSSTYTDLIDERQAAVEAILDAGHIPAGMELFKAGKSQIETIKRWIDESDVYMLILGGRYGSVEEESGLSYTELEYRYALSKNMPVFAIVLEESFLFTKASLLEKDSIFEKKNKKKYNSFKKFVETNIVKFAHNADKISTIIHSQLNDLLNNSEIELIGWTRDLIGISNHEGLFPLKAFNNYLMYFTEMLESAIKDKVSNSHITIHDFCSKVNMDHKKLNDVLSGKITLNEKDYRTIMYELNLPSLEEKLFDYVFKSYYMWHNMP